MGDSTEISIKSFDYIMNVDFSTFYVMGIPNPFIEDDDELHDC